MLPKPFQVTISTLAFTDADEAGCVLVQLYLVPLPVGAFHIPTLRTQARPCDSLWSINCEWNWCASFSKQKLSELVSDSLFRGAWPCSREQMLCQPLPTKKKWAWGQGLPWWTCRGVDSKTIIGSPELWGSLVNWVLPDWFRWVLFYKFSFLSYPSIQANLLQMLLSLRTALSRVILVVDSRKGMHSASWLMLR